LTDAKVWLAAGQIFFTLSVGFGTIQVYASYLRSRDDVVVTGLSTTMVNEWGEVILGSTIAIPIAYAFFEPQGTMDVAQEGAFNLGFATMPGEIFDTVYPESASEAQHHLQTTLAPAGGAAIVELTFQAPGTYVLVAHSLSRVIKGAVGSVVVEGHEATEVYGKLPGM
jgi:Sodium:neurotransmitter symporter family